MKVDIEKVLKGLAHCYGTETGSHKRNCDDCPYDNGYEDELRCGVLERDAYVAIKQLRSENNRLKAYDEQRDIALHARLIAETRASTAREIICEIETEAKNNILGIRQLEPQNDFLCGGIRAFEIVLRFLAELKKKYKKDVK